MMKTLKNLKFMNTKKIMKTMKMMNTMKTMKIIKMIKTIKTMMKKKKNEVKQDKKIEKIPNRLKIKQCDTYLVYLNDGSNPTFPEEINDAVTKKIYNWKKYVENKYYLIDRNTLGYKEKKRPLKKDQFNKYK